MDPTPTTSRLFDLAPTPAERAEYRARNRALEAPLFELERAGRTFPVCPACGGSDGPNVVGPCTCHRTGAEALELET